MVQETVKTTGFCVITNIVSTVTRTGKGLYSLRLTSQFIH
jgi:hypothetical protein